MKNKSSYAPLCICLLIVVAVIFFFFLYQGGRWIEQRTEKPEVRGDHTQRYAYEKTLEADGVTYRVRKDITTVLLIGTDVQAQHLTPQGYRDGGQADFLWLLIMDNTNQTITQIQIDRDTMTPITVLGVMGNKSGTRTAQICLAHGFGDGGEQSCELTAEAVSGLFCGIPIDLYLALNMDGISVLNDALGGVTVTLKDDFSDFDPVMVPGVTLTLQGDQAEYYVRNRMGIGVGTNEERMRRQETYLSEISEMLHAQVRTDKEYIGTLYDELLPYMTTNISRGRLINEIWAAKDYLQEDTVQLTGEHRIGHDGFVEFHVDETALQQFVIKQFYERVK